MNHDVSLKHFRKTLPADEYIRRFADRERLMGYCRDCLNFGKTWACPPFDYDISLYINKYKYITVFVTQITPADAGLPLADCGELLLPMRIKMEKELLRLERLSSGRAFAYAGRCHYCQPAACTRPQNLPCRHPDLVRPSLEAAGFDLMKTSLELFGLPMKWGAAGKMPEYLLAVSGLFHDYLLDENIFTQWD